MPYYMGDFYEGDPGFFSFLGRAAKAAVGFIPGIGPAASAALSTIGSRGASRALPAAAGVATTGIVRRVAGTVAPAAASAGRLISKHPVLSAVAAAGALTAGGTAAHMLRGKHLGRKRRMRVTNPKALRRAIRRTHGFAKLAMRTIHLCYPKKRARFGGFKKRRAK